MWSANIFFSCTKGYSPLLQTYRGFQYKAMDLISAPVYQTFLSSKDAVSLVICTTMNMVERSSWLHRASIISNTLFSN